jgi:hypothetical protein
MRPILRRARPIGVRVRPYAGPIEGSPPHPPQATVVADKGLYEPPAPAGAPEIPPIQIVRVRFDDGQEQILPAFKVSTAPPRD